MANTAQIPIMRSPPSRTELYPDTKDVVGYFAGLAEREWRGTEGCDKTERQKVSVIARRFALANSPDPRVLSDEQCEDQIEEALGKALEHLTLSILANDPSVGSAWATHSRLSKSREDVSMSVDSTMDALNALYIVAPSLMACDQESRVCDDALPRKCVEMIALVRPKCWITDLCDYQVDGEEVYLKTRANWDFVKWLWTKVIEYYDIWIDETVLRILCAVPLQGGGRLTENGFCHEA